MNVCRILLEKRYLKFLHLPGSLFVCFLGGWGHRRDRVSLNLAAFETFSLEFFLPVYASHSGIKGIRHHTHLVVPTLITTLDSIKCFKDIKRERDLNNLLEVLYCFLHRVSADRCKVLNGFQVY